MITRETRGGMYHGMDNRFGGEARSVPPNCEVLSNYREMLRILIASEPKCLC